MRRRSSTRAHPCGTDTARAHCCSGADNAANQYSRACANGSACTDGNYRSRAHGSPYAGADASPRRRSAYCDANPHSHSDYPDTYPYRDANPHTRPYCISYICAIYSG